jgi:hypothetical protein
MVAAILATAPLLLVVVVVVVQEGAPGEGGAYLPASKDWHCINAVL